MLKQAPNPFPAGWKDAAGLWWQDKFKPIAGCIVNLILNIILVQHIGITGVVLSTVVSYLFIEYPWETHVLFGQYFKVSKKRYYSSVLYNAVISIANTVICFTISSMVQISSIPSFLLAGCIFFIISNLVFAVCYHRSSELHYVLSLVKGRVRK